VPTAEAGVSAGVTVNLMTNAGSGGDAQGDTFFSIEHVFASELDDTLIGSSGANTLHGDAPVLSEGCQPLIFRQDAPIRYCVWLSRAADPYRASGLVR
jgi:hypothetical protein